jgi:hypothetical protein
LVHDDGEESFDLFEPKSSLFFTLVLFSYRTKVNESTKFTPYELVFARKCNLFKDFKTSPEKDEVNQILARAYEKITWNTRYP